MNKIKEWIKSAIEKWIVGIIAGAIMLVGSAVWDYSQRFYTLPDRFDHMEQRIDSLIIEFQYQNNYQYQTKQ
jgi:hypothetical protein